MKMKALAGTIIFSIGFILLCLFLFYDMGRRIASVEPECTKRFFLEIGVEDPVRYMQYITFEYPFSWHSVADLDPKKHLSIEVKNYQICNGKVAWSFGSHSDEYRRWDISRLTNDDDKVDDDLTYFDPYISAFDGILSIVNPWHEKWHNCPFSKKLRSEIHQTGTTFIDNTEVDIYETPDGFMFYRIFFGQKDGILRQQIMYNHKGKSLDEIRKWRVIKISESIDKSLFDFTPPKGVKVLDARQ